MKAGSLILMILTLSVAAAAAPPVELIQNVTARQNVALNVILGVIAILVAYGRFVVTPF